MSDAPAAAAAAGSGVAAVKEMKRQSSQKTLHGVVPPAELAKPFDVIVIGGGPAGVAAVQKAAFLGRRALIIDDAACAPNELDLTFGAPTGLFSKALRDTAKHVDVKLLEAMGMDKKVVWAQVQSSVGKLAGNNALTTTKMLSEFKVLYLRARAVLDGDGAAGVVATTKDGTEHKIGASRVLIATGSTPTRDAAVPFDDKHVFDSDSIAKLSFLPRRVVIAGAGIIAIEYAKIFAKLHASVTMLVRRDVMSSLERIGLDHDIANGLIDDLHASGVTILTNTSTSGFTLPDDDDDEDASLAISLKGGEGTPDSIECDVFLAAMGRRPTVSGLGLGEASIDPKSGSIKVDAKFHVEGAPESVFAAGDAIGAPALASTGVEQAKAAISCMFDESAEDKATVNRDNFPVGVWTIPEIGYFGLTKEAAIKKGLDAEQGIAPYSACLRGRVFAPQGFLKLVFDRSDGRIVGVHIFGSDACELIHFGMELVTGQRTIFDVMHMLFTAVTFHELFKFAALDANSKLKFGVQWRTIFKALVDSGVQKGDLESLRAKFNEIDKDSSGQVSGPPYSRGRMLPPVGTRRLPLHTAGFPRATAQPPRVFSHSVYQPCACT